MALLLSQAPSLHASTLYNPALNSAAIPADAQAVWLGAVLALSFVLVAGMERRGKKKRTEIEPVLKTLSCDAAWFDREGRCLEVLRNSLTPLEAGRYLHETLAEESAKTIQDSIRSTFESGEAVIFEFPLCASKVEAWREGNTLRFGNRALCLCRDITVRKAAEAALLSEKERFHSILRSIGNGVITTDNNARVLYLNPEAERLTGWKNEKAEGSPLSVIFRILVEASREPAENPALAAIRDSGLQPARNSLLLIRRDGTECGIDESAAPILDEEGEAIGAVIVFHDISSSKHLLWQAGHDALTGLLNRVLLHDRLIHAMASVKRQGKLLAVLFIDLDKFKSVNDNMGHSAGDILLKEVAIRLKNAIRAEDTAARIGGDEFVVLQEASDKSEVKSSLERIMNIMRPSFILEGKPVDISLSIGIVIYPENNAEPETLLRQADMAMYHAKQSGRDQYHFFDARMDRAALENRERQSRIESALKKGELRLYYQPKINLRNGRIMGLEALIRWHDPSRDAPVLPADFLPAVQDSQLIVEIGSWVINDALNQMRTWQDQGITVDVSVNVANRQLHDPNFLDGLKSALENHPDVAPSRFEIEILETTAIADFKFIQEVLAGCRELGIKLALDDFGTGYASLSYLKNLPVDRLKIDRSFVSDMSENEDNIAVVRSIVSMSKIFKREVIAEGLESPLQGEALIRMGCNLAQGFGIAKPMPSEIIPKWMTGWSQSPDWIKH